MQNRFTCSIIEQAEMDTSVHLRYLRRSMRYSLLFTITIILIDAISVATSEVSGRSAEYIREIMSISPGPILLIALLLSAGIQFYLLRRIRTNYAEIKQKWKKNGVDGREQVKKSLTDIDYDIIGAVNTSLKIWPFIAFLFILYFIGCLSMLIELILGIGTNITLGPPVALNLTTIIISVYFFVAQTVSWRSQRERMKRLESMEKQIMEELKL